MPTVAVCLVPKHTVTTEPTTTVELPVTQSTENGFVVTSVKEIGLIILAGVTGGCGHLGSCVSTSLGKYTHWSRLYHWQIYHTTCSRSNELTKSVNFSLVRSSYSSCVLRKRYRLQYHDLARSNVLR